MPAVKHPDQRHPRAKPRKNTAGLVSIAGKRDEIPELPAKMSGLPPLTSTREAWDRFWSSNVAELVETDSDLGAVLRWAELLDERERAASAFRSLRLVEGSQGQLVLNPLWGVVRSCDTELRALEDRLGMTPKARLQLGVTFGEAGKSLDQLNRLLERDADDDEAEGDEAFDPRQVIEATAT